MTFHNRYTSITLEAYPLWRVISVNEAYPLWRVISVVEAYPLWKVISVIEVYTDDLP
jgi:hypothetical protein